MNDEILNSLKEKIFSVLLKQTEIIDFENWLYNQNEIIELIDNDKSIYDLVTINFKDEGAFELLKDKAFEKFEFEEYIVLVIGFNCNKILLQDSWENIYKLFREIYAFFDYEKEYALMWEFYSINSRIDLIDNIGGYESETNISNEILKLSRKIVERLNELKTPEEKVHFLETGFDKSNEMKIEKVKTNKNKKGRKWYQFWK